MALRPLAKPAIVCVLGLMALLSPQTAKPLPVALSCYTCYPKDVCPTEEDANAACANNNPACPILLECVDAHALCGTNQSFLQCTAP